MVLQLGVDQPWMSSMSWSKDSSHAVWWRQAIEAAGSFGSCPGLFATSVLFGVLLFVNTFVTIQRDCIIDVSTHAKSRESFDQLLERMAGFHRESMHVPYDLHTQFLANQGLS